jgi:hypothetical protein
MKLLFMLVAFSAVSASAQAPAPAKPLGSWDLEYDRTILRMHAEPIRTRDRVRMTLRSVGDSVLGDLVMLSQADSAKLVLRGTAKANAWTLYVDEPKPQGLAVMLIPIEAAMNWLKEAVHGVSPTVTRFELVAKGDSVTGTRIVTGFPSPDARTAPVSGTRRK